MWLKDRLWSILMEIPRKLCAYTLTHVHMVRTYTVVGTEHQKTQNFEAPSFVAYTKSLSLATIQILGDFREFEFLGVLF